MPLRSADTILARISHNTECIGVANQQKSSCRNNSRSAPTPTKCISPDFFGFEPVEARAMVAAFDAGAVTSDAGALLLGATDRTIRMMDRLASCFHDLRCWELIEHQVVTPVGAGVWDCAWL